MHPSYHQIQFNLPKKWIQAAFVHAYQLASILVHFSFKIDNPSIHKVKGD